MDIRIFSRPVDFGRDAKLAEGIVAELRCIYRRKAIQVMRRFSRGSVLLVAGKVLTSQMIDAEYSRDTTSI